VPRRSVTLAVLLEALMVVIAAVGFAFAANELSPRGLALGRNYFPSGSRSNAPPRTAPSPAPAATLTNTGPTEGEITQRLKDKGLQPIGREETERLFHDPRYAQERIIFVDARNKDEYADGHIPGAFQLDPYHPEKELAGVLGACQNAEQVIVYCNGGDCEDADSTALMLRDDGVQGEKLFVYGGGFTDWGDQHLPIEQGARNSRLAPGATK
jgi:rhodanese-related sulfurtransferase